MSDPLFILNEAHLYRATQKQLVDLCLGAMNTANIQHAALEQMTNLIEQATLQLGVWPPAAQT